MAIKQNVQFQGRYNGKETNDYPITTLENVDGTALVKQTLEGADYIPVMDSAGGGQMKKVPVSELLKQVSAMKPLLVKIKLSASGWSGNTQTVTVTGILADETKQVIVPAPAPASWETAGKAGVCCTAQGAGSLTFVCSQVPEVDLDYHVSVQGVRA